MGNQITCESCSHFSPEALVAEAVCHWYGTFTAESVAFALQLAKDERQLRQQEGMVRDAAKASGEDALPVRVRIVSHCGIEAEKGIQLVNETTRGSARCRHQPKPETDRACQSCRHRRVKDGAEFDQSFYSAIDEFNFRASTGLSGSPGIEPTDLLRLKDQRRNLELTIASLRGGAIAFEPEELDYCGLLSDEPKSYSTCVFTNPSASCRLWEPDETTTR